MIHTLAFCCSEAEKGRYFKWIWDRCVVCHKVPALYHFADGPCFWNQVLTQPVEGVLILLPEVQGKLLFEELQRRCPSIKTLCFCNAEAPSPFSKERTFFPHPLTQEHMEQALAWFDIVPAASGDSARQIFTAPGCLTPQSWLGQWAVGNIGALQKLLPLCKATEKNGTCSVD